MNAHVPEVIAEKYEIYRVVTDYEGLEDGFIERVEDINTTYEQIDMAAGFTKGNTQKLLSKSRERWARTFGVESLGKMLKGTGLALVLVVDDERFAPVKADLIQRKRPRKPANVGSRKPAWLFTKKKAREMAQKRYSLMTETQRKRLAKKAGKASGKARRRKARQKSGALLTNLSQSSSSHGQIASTIECQMVLGQAKAEAQISAPHADAACGAASP